MYFKCLTAPVSWFLAHSCLQAFLGHVLPAVPPKQWLLVQFRANHQMRENLGNMVVMFFCITTIFRCVCIYIYAVESKPGPRFAFFESQPGPSFLFCFVFQKSSSFCRENEILKKNEQQKKTKKHHFLSQNLVQLCCATYLDQVLTQPWTRF